MFLRVQSCKLLRVSKVYWKFLTPTFTREICYFLKSSLLFECIMLLVLAKLPPGKGCDLSWPWVRWRDATLALCVFSRINIHCIHLCLYTTKTIYFCCFVFAMPAFAPFEISYSIFSYRQLKRKCFFFSWLSLPNIFFCSRSNWNG